jgi:hypothetical protein
MLQLYSNCQPTLQRITFFEQCVLSAPWTKQQHALDRREQKTKHLEQLLQAFNMHIGLQPSTNSLDLHTEPSLAQAIATSNEQQKPASLRHESTSHKIKSKECCERCERTPQHELSQEETNTVNAGYPSIEYLAPVHHGHTCACSPSRINVYHLHRKPARNIRSLLPPEGTIYHTSSSCCDTILHSPHSPHSPHSHMPPKRSSL